MQVYVDGVDASEVRPIQCAGDHKIIAQVVVLFQGPAVQNNLIGMNVKDITKLFGREKNLCVRIGNFIYRAIAMKWLKPGHIALNPSQNQDNASARFDYGLQSCVLVSPLKYTPGDYPVLKKIRIKISAHDQNYICSRRGFVELDINQLRKSVSELWKDDFFHQGQTLYFEHEHGCFQFYLDKLECDQECLKGRIGKETKISFHTEQDSPIWIVENEPQTQVLSLACTINKIVKATFDEAPPLPLPVSEDWLRKEVIKELRNTWFSRDHRITLEHKDNYQLFLNISTIGTANLFQNKKSIPCYESRYRFSDEKNLVVVFPVTPSTDVCVLKGSPQKAKQIYFTVLQKYDSKVDKNLGNNSKNWILIEELKQALQFKKSFFFTGCKEIVKLSKGKYLLQLKEIKDARGKKIQEKNKHKSPWILSPETELRFRVDRGSKLQLIDRKELVELNSIEFEVKPIDAEAKFSISSKELNHLVLDELETQELRMIQGESKKIVLDSGHTVELKIAELKFMDEKRSGEYFYSGKITSRTKIDFKSSSDNVSISTEECVEDPISFIAEQGLVGLPEDCEQVIRSLLLPFGKLKEEFKLRGSVPIKGVLLSGLPGTGKSTLANLIGKILKGRVKQISGTEVYNKWVGESERNVRELFNVSNDDEINVIIIDEIDAILPPRNGRSTQSWQKTVVSEFLSQWDGLAKKKKIIVIGTTNYKDGIDSAALRPGRFDKQIAIKLPDESARIRIFKLHLKRLVDVNRIHPDVSIERLARESRGLTGAEIRGIVNAADNSSELRLDEAELSDRERFEKFKKQLNSSVKEEEINQLVNQSMGFTRLDFKVLQSNSSVKKAKDAIQTQKKERLQVTYEDFSTAIRSALEKKRKDAEIVGRYIH